MHIHCTTFYLVLSELKVESLLLTTGDLFWSPACESAEVCSFCAMVKYQQLRQRPGNKCLLCTVTSLMFVFRNSSRRAAAGEVRELQLVLLPNWSGLASPPDGRDMCLIRHFMAFKLCFFIVNKSHVRSQTNTAKHWLSRASNK